MPVESSAIALILVLDDGASKAGSCAVLHVSEEHLTPEVPEARPNQQARHVPLNDLPVTTAYSCTGQEHERPHDQEQPHPQELDKVHVEDIVLLAHVDPGQRQEVAEERAHEERERVERDLDLRLDEEDLAAPLHHDEAQDVLDGRLLGQGLGALGCPPALLYGGLERPLRAPATTLPGGGRSRGHRCFLAPAGPPPRS